MGELEKIVLISLNELTSTLISDYS